MAISYAIWPDVSRYYVLGVARESKVSKVIKLKINI